MSQFIEVHDNSQDGRAGLQSLSGPFAFGQNNTGQAFVSARGALFSLAESYAAIRSALLKAGLLVVVEEEEKAVETKPESVQKDAPSELLRLTKEQLEDMTFYTLFRWYAELWPHMKNSPKATQIHSWILQVAEERVARAFEQGKASAKPADKADSPRDLVLDELPNWTIEGCLQQYAIAERLKVIGSDDEVKRAAIRQKYIIAELQRRIDAKPEQVVRLRVKDYDCGHLRMKEAAIVDPHGHGCWPISGICERVEDVKRVAEKKIRFINPSARIEWENET